MSKEKVIIRFRRDHSLFIWGSAKVIFIVNICCFWAWGRDWILGPHPHRGSLLGEKETQKAFNNCSGLPLQHWKIEKSQTYAWLPTQDIYLVFKLYERLKSKASGKESNYSCIIMKEWPLGEYAWTKSPAEFQGQRVKDNQLSQTSWRPIS